MLEDIYDEMGYKSYTINCYVDPKNCSITPTGSNANIERNVKENTITKIAEILNNLLPPLQIVAGNHCITCVEYEDEFYYYDPTNLAYLGKSGSYDLDILNGTVNFTIRYYTILMFGELTSIETVTSTNEKLYYEDVINIDPTSISYDDLNIFYANEKERYSKIATYSDNILSNQWIPIIIASITLSAAKEVLINQKEKILSKKRKNK